MSRQLPSHASLEQLKKQAKDLLKAHKRKDAGSCAALRLLRQFAGKSDHEILEVPLSLTEVHFALAMDYGFRSWRELKGYVQKHQHRPDQIVQSDGAVVLEQTRQLFDSLQNDDLQQRSEAWVLLVLMHAAGRTDIDYATIMATSGWAGQFVYSAKPDWPSFVPPGPTADNACSAAGIELIPVEPDSVEEAFQFVRESVDLGRPVQVNYLEDGMFSGYADPAEPGGRKVHLLCIPFASHGEWWTLQDLRDKWWNGPCAKRLLRLGEAIEPKDPRKTAIDVMRGLVRLATTDYWKIPSAAAALTGFAALQRYAEDIADVSKTMQDNDGTNKDTCFFERGWGCYAVYPQWTARECSARYLERGARLLDEPMASHVGQAARHYHKAHHHWREWERHLGRPEELGSYDQRWADPAHRAAGSAAVRQAISSERSAIAELEKALALVA